MLAGRSLMRPTLLRPPGEINTLQGNLNWVASREHELSHPVWNGREEELTPLCNAAESDSANLDHVAELLVRTGFEPQEALMLLVPEAFRNHPDLVKQYPEVCERHKDEHDVALYITGVRGCWGLGWCVLGNKGL